MCTRFAEKDFDLIYLHHCHADMPQIRLVQNNEITMVEKIQTTIVNTIPLWKSQMVLVPLASRIQPKPYVLESPSPT